MNARPIPVILDTGIGNDVNDNCALGLTIRESPASPRVMAVRSRPRSAGAISTAIRITSSRACSAAHEF